MVATAWTEATAAPAAIAAAIPSHGLWTKWVTVAAVKAPASMSPSSAMLITPARSEKSPPRAAKRSGVARRMAELTRPRFQRSCTSAPAPRRGAPAVEGAGGDEEDDDPLEHRHQVLRDVRGEDVDEEPAAEEGAEEEGRREHP